ncbi:DedA family protein [Paenibacillus chibensis]|uniref:DedA family protein n=1 Tax=Paenibacillus chibensis TaxID=59846 RepID=UPI000FDB186F|nr:DedA family protein [Paenibacillus chibensis]MEC0370817.1 DedA family protein [Paenibacillus chibensis]
MHFISDIISQLFHWIQSLGYFGIMLGLMIEVIPSEIVLAYGGFLVSSGHINFVGAVLFGIIGGVIAQLFVYWIGRYGGRPVLEKYGKYIFIHKKHIDYAEAWFTKYGTGVIFTARFIPVVRHAISIPAGISKMNVWRFTLLTTLAIIPWSMLFVYLGYVLGDQWEHVDEKAAPYITPILLIALALLIVYFVIKMVKNRSGKGTK